MKVFLILFLIFIAVILLGHIYKTIFGNKSLGDELQKEQTKDDDK